MSLPCHLCLRASNDKPGWVLDCYAKWAICPKCIQQKKALVADVGKQNYPGMADPISAYWDQQRQCRYCGHDYLFSAQEQQFWYEECQFYTDSAPVACLPCRQTLKRRKLSLQELSEMGKPAMGCDWVELEKRADLAYAALAPDKALEYLRRAKNACSDSEQKHRLELKIVQWSERPPLPLEMKYWSVNRQVEQIEMHYNFEREPVLTWQERQRGLAELALPADQLEPVARLNGCRLEPLKGPSHPETWAWVHSDGTVQSGTGSRARVTIDHDTGVLLWLPGSGSSSGRTGFISKNGVVYGPEGELPWLGDPHRAEHPDSEGG